MGKRRFPDAAKAMFDSIKEVMPEDIDPAKLDVVLEHCRSRSLDDVWYIVTIREELGNATDSRSRRSLVWEYDVSNAEECCL